MSCADVCLDMYYDGDNEFYSERIVKAKKPHRCCECQRTIAPSESYEHVSGRSEGDFWTAKTCADCRAIRKALVCGTWVFGGLWEAIEESVFPEWLRVSPIDCLAKIDERSARDLLRHRFRDWRDGRPGGTP